MSDQIIVCKIQEEPITVGIEKEDTIVATINPDTFVISCIVNEEPKITCVINDEPVINIEISEVSGGSPVNGDVLAQYILSEDLTSFVNGSRTDFVTAVNYIAGTLKIWINGLKERTIIELTLNSFRLSPAPDAGDSLEIEYIRNDN